MPFTSIAGSANVRQVEVLGGPRVLRPRALLGELVGAASAARASPQAPPPSARMMPCAQRLGQPPVARDAALESVVISACAALSAAPP